MNVLVYKFSKPTSLFLLVPEGEEFPESIGSGHTGVWSYHKTICNFENSKPRIAVDMHRAIRDMHENGYHLTSTDS
jgi:hypothetical protein